MGLGLGFGLGSLLGWLALTLTLATSVPHRRRWCAWEWSKTDGGGSCLEAVPRVRVRVRIRVK